MAVAQVAQGRLMGWYLGKPVYENDPRLSKFLEKPAFVPARGFLKIHRPVLFCSWCGRETDDWEKSCSFCGGSK